MEATSIQQDVSGKVVEAQRFILKDGAGKVRALLRCSADGDPELRLMDSDGQPRLAVGLDGGAVVRLLGRNGRPRAELRCDDGNDLVGLHLTDAAGVVRAVLSQGALGGSQVQFFDEQGRERVFAGSGPCGTSVVQLYGPHGQLGASLNLSDGLPGMLTFGRRERSLLRWTTARRGWCIGRNLRRAD